MDSHVGGRRFGLLANLLGLVSAHRLLGETSERSQRASKLVKCQPVDVAQWRGEEDIHRLSCKRSRLLKHLGRRQLKDCFSRQHAMIRERPALTWAL